MNHKLKQNKMSVSEAVKKVLANYPYIDEFLNDELVNYSALAVKITPKLREIAGREKINREAAVMGIIRYAQTLKAEKLPKAVLETVAKSTITLKTDIMFTTMPKTIKNLKTLEKFYSKISWDKGEVFFIVQGISEISVVIDKANHQGLVSELKGEKISHQYPETSIIIVHSPPQAAGPGFIHFVTGPIAKAGISIEMLTLTHDTIFLVDAKNSAKLFEILKTLIDECRKIN